MSDTQVRTSDVGSNAEPELAGQRVVVLGGSSGMGLETARLARARGAAVTLTARDPDRLKRVGDELGASTAAFDVLDFDQLSRFFKEQTEPIDHVMGTGPGPYYSPPAEFDFARRNPGIVGHFCLPTQA